MLFVADGNSIKHVNNWHLESLMWIAAQCGWNLWDYSLSVLTGKQDLVLFFFFILPYIELQRVLHIWQTENMQHGVKASLYLTRHSICLCIAVWLLCVPWVTNVRHFLPQLFSFLCGFYFSFFLSARVKRSGGVLSRKKSLLFHQYRWCHQRGWSCIYFCEFVFILFAVLTKLGRVLCFLIRIHLAMLCHHATNFLFPLCTVGKVVNFFISVILQSVSSSQESTWQTNRP